MTSMLRLSPSQIRALAGCITGDVGDEAFAYRTKADIESFIEFTGAEYAIWGGMDLSRADHTIAFIEAAQATGREGESGLCTEVEKIIVALMDRREFSSDKAHAGAVERMNEILKGLPVEVRVATDGTIGVASTLRTQAQRVLDEQIHTVFGEVVAGSKLAAARTHYAKAKRYLAGPDPDYENAAKESVLAVESLVVTLTGESDFTKAIRKATNNGLVPRPLDEIAMKLYAYRGNEPGVAHASAAVPDVDQLEAELIFNLSGALSAYLAQRLAKS
jgi:hypothetical protein